MGDGLEEKVRNGTFAPSMPPAGPISFMSRSGALGVTVLDYAAVDTRGAAACW